MGVAGKARERRALLCAKDEQRRMARSAGRDRVHCALTHMVSSFVAEMLSVHAGRQRETSGQLPNLG